VQQPPKDFLYYLSYREIGTGEFLTADSASAKWNPVVTHRVPCHRSTMARQRTRRGHVNGIGGATSSPDTETHVRVSDPDVQAIINHLDEAGPQSIAQLAGKTRLPRAYLRLHLEALADAGIITYTEGYATIRLTDHAGGALDGE
jgi:hypothetical protein